MKKVLMMTLVAVSALSLAGCKGSTDSKDNFKIGMVSVGDTSETYSKAHIEGLQNALKANGLSAEKNLILKTKIGEEASTVKTNLQEIVDAGAKVVITNSYGHQDGAYQFAKDNKDVKVISMTGDYAAISGLDNFYNAFDNIYEARYVSGYIGGLKLADMITANKASKGTNTAYPNDYEIGYVGAYNYAEVVSGYTAFYLGLKAGAGIDNIHMSVKYTNSWYDHDAEKEAAKALLNGGAIIVGQHADSTGAPEAVNEYLKNSEDASKGAHAAYSVGYNVDMTTAAPDAAIASSTNNWEKYYDYVIKQALAGKDLDKDWAKGYADEAVGVVGFGKNAPTDAATKAKAMAKKITDGDVRVFDTSKFTVSNPDGNYGVTVDASKHVSSYKVDFSYKDWSQGGKVIFQGETKEEVKTAGTVNYIQESVDRSAPYFSIRIDGITEIAAAK
jgi:basic membrane protein A